MFSLLKPTVLLNWFSWEEGVSTPSFSSSPILPFPLHHLSLPAFFEDNLIFLETLSTSFEVLPTTSLFSSTIDLVSATLHRPWHRTRIIFEDFRFDFLKIRSVIFRKTKRETLHFTMLMGPSASSRRQLHFHPATTSRRVASTRSCVDLTRGRVILVLARGSAHNTHVASLRSSIVQRAVSEG